MTDALTDIPELADLESGRSLIRIPPEQNVPFTPRVRALVDTDEFQRLTEISQLGLVSRVYPGARHSRKPPRLSLSHLLPSRKPAPSPYSPKSSNSWLPPLQKRPSWPA